MWCFGSAAINKNGLDIAIGLDFPPVQRLATRRSAPQLGVYTNVLADVCRLSDFSTAQRVAPSFESNQFAWLRQAKNLSGHFLSRRYPAARDLCGNGRMHKHVAKTGGVYE